MTKHPLSGLHQDKKLSWGRKEAAYEEKVVGYLLSKYKIASVKQELLRAQYSATGIRQLTLMQFFNRFGNFPIYLQSGLIPYISSDCAVDKLFNRFTTRKIVNMYDELDDSVPEEFEAWPRGLVTNWTYISRGLVLHNMAPDMESKGVRMVWSDGGTKKKHAKHFTLEPLPQLLDNLAWEP